MNNQEIITNYYHKHRNEIVDFVAVRIQDKVEAQDIVQDLFLRLLNGHKLTTEQTLPCLVYTMARNRVADYFRRLHVFEEYEHYIRRRDNSDSPMESVFSARQVLERMEFTLARLPEECRKVYRLHIYGGMQVREISEELNENYKHVEYQLGIARKTMRKHLKACI